jgi:hypothetical protein
MTFEKTDKINLTECLKKLIGYTYTWTPIDKPVSEAKYITLKPKSRSGNPRLIVQQPSSKLNQDFYNVKFNETLQIGPLPLVNIKTLNIHDASDKQIINSLVKSNLIVQLDLGQSVYEDETRPAPRKIQSSKFNLVKTVKAFSEDEIQEYYLSLLTFIHPFCTIKKIGRKSEFISSSDLTDLLDLFNQVKHQEYQSEKNKKKIDNTIDLLHEYKQIKQNLTKFYCFISNSLKQVKRLMLASSKIQDLNQYLDSKNQIKSDFNSLFGFWLEYIFLEGLKSYSEQSPAEFNFFQIQNINILQYQVDKNDPKAKPFSKIFIKHLEPFKTLPPYISLLRIIADAVKIFSQEELNSSDYNFQTRLNRFEVCFNQVKKFDFIDEKRLEYAKKLVFFMTYCDIIIDSSDEISNPDLFQNIENGVENYTNATTACLKAIEKIVFGDE